jgi:DNA repair protein RadD
MELRDYQKEAVFSLVTAMGQEQSVLLQAATGAGKTVIICDLLKKLLVSSPKGRVLILAHRRELVQQMADKLARVWPDHPPVSVACSGASKRIMHHGSIVIASIQTLARRIGDVMPFNLMIVDECHRMPDATERDSQYITVLEALRSYNPEMRLLGVTATPFRLGHGYIYGDGCKEGNINLFAARHHHIGVKDLTGQGFLAPIRGKVNLDSGLAADLAGVTVRGDYAEGELGALMAKKIYTAAAVRSMETHASERRHIMVFACTIGHCEALTDAFVEAGHMAACVHSRTPKAERDGILRDFVAGKLRILVNVSVLIEGFDAPLTDCIIMARPTLSPALYLQQAGRGLRTAEGKEDCLLIDLVGNAMQFGQDFDNVRVNIPKISEEDGEAPSKACPECEELVHAAAMECPNCGYLFPEKEVEEAAPPELVDMSFNSVNAGFEATIERGELEEYTSRAEKEMLRVSLYVDQSITPIYHYVNYDSEAHWFTKQKSAIWWRTWHGWEVDIPPNNDAALFLFDGKAATGRMVTIQQEGKFLKTKGW